MLEVVANITESFDLRVVQLQLAAQADQHAQALRLLVRALELDPASLLDDALLEDALDRGVLV